jgi:HAMP domain-containing protein
MTPLEALDAGTRRLAGGNFAEPVRVESGDEFEGLAASFNRMAAELQGQFRTQQALQEVGRAALEAEGPETVLTALFTRSRTLLGAGELSVALSRPDDPFWWRAVSASAHATSQAPRDLHPEPWEVEELLSHPDGFVVHRGARGRNYFVLPGAELEREAIVLPLLRKGVLGGAIVLDCEPSREGYQAALDLARRYADPIGVALVNTQLVDQLEALNLGALTALARAIDAVSPWTAGHSERVTVGAVEIGRRLELPESDLELLHRGGLLHDVGKVGIPSALLDKPGKLTSEEYELVKRHPAIGATILAPIGAYRAVIPLVLHHHELLDGSGYPHGLAGDQIPLLVRIMTVADVYDALTSERPYRPAWSPDRALAFLREGTRRQFDPRVVEALACSVEAGWRPSNLVRPLEVLHSGAAHRYSLWPEPDRGRGAVGPVSALPAEVRTA